MLIYSWYHVTLEVKGIYIKIAFITVLSIYCSRILYSTETDDFNNLNIDK